MKYSFALTVSLVLVLVHRGLSEEAIVETFNQWHRGFYGVISIKLQDKVEHGWQVKVMFTKPVAGLVVWNAVVESISQDKTTYTLKNKFWNTELPAEGLIKLRFLGLKKTFGEKIRKMSAEFIRLGEESGSGVDF